MPESAGEKGEMADIIFKNKKKLPVYSVSVCQI